MTKYGKKELILYNRFETDLEKVENFKIHLKAFATNKIYSDLDYIEFRNDFLWNLKLKHVLPNFIKEQSDPIEFWNFISGIPFHEKRRELIDIEFREITQLAIELSSLS